MPESDNEQPDINSRTSRKKELRHLREMGFELAALSPAQLAKMSLPEELVVLILFAKSLKSHGAKKRHMQHVGKKIREMDVEHIQAELKRLKYIDTKNTALFHKTESWRDKLLNNGDAALKELITQHPNADSQKLRQLIRQGQKDISKEVNSGAAKKLFIYLKALLSARK